MYNGIGLETARGSGTNGYVQRNMAFVRPRKDKISYKTEEEIAKSEALLNREPNLEILEHERKRKIELKCMELQELMEDQGFEKDAIEQKVDAFRQKLIEKDDSEKPQITLDESGRPIATGTHQIAAASMDRNKKLRDAFGISADYVDGSSMDPLRKQKEMDARAAAKQKYNIIKDPEDDLPPVKGGRKDQLPDVVSSVKKSEKKQKSDRSETRKVRSSPPEEGEVSQEDDHRADRKKRPRDNSDRKKETDRRTSPGDRKKKRARSPSLSSESSGSESDAEGSDSDGGKRYKGETKSEKKVASKQRRSASPQEHHRSGQQSRDRGERRGESPSRDRKRKFIPDRKRPASPERDRSATPDRRRPASPDRNRSPRRERNFSPDRKRRSPSPRRPSKASPDRRRPLSPERNRRQVSPVRVGKVGGANEVERPRPDRKKSPPPKSRRDRSSSSNSGSHSSLQQKLKSKIQEKSPIRRRSSSSSSSSSSDSSNSPHREQSPIRPEKGGRLRSPERRRYSPGSPQGRKTDDVRKSGRRS